MAITALPTAPQRTNAPDVFATRADAWVAALDQFTTEANALQTDVNAKQVLASASEVAAELAETNAEAAQAASEAARDISIANASGTVAAGSAKDWASKAEDSEVTTGYYSALHWAAKAAASVSTLPAGTINDILIASDKTWSSEKINADIELSKKITPLNKTSNYTITGINRANLITGTGSITFNIDSAATIGNGWFCYVQNIGGNNITVEPYGAETIDGQTNVILEPDNLFLIISDGTNLKCIRLHKPQPHYITSSKTWTCPAGVYDIEVELWAGGGSGSYANSAATYPFSGGSGGSYSSKKIAITPGTTKVITIGLGGASKTTEGSGTDGGISSFSTDITCSGGKGGTPYMLNTTITLASGGDINISGEQGCAIIAGGYSFSLGGGCFKTPNVKGVMGTPVNGRYPGGGGSGTTGTSSGSGADGLCIIWY